jgi:hypothetical protein
MASASRAETGPTPSDPSAIAGNPAAVNVTPGIGDLGRLLGLAADSGVLVSNGNLVLSGAASRARPATIICW